MNFQAIFMALLTLFAIVGPASSDQISGIVASAKDGDTIYVQDFGYVRLTDVDCPEMGTIEGVHAKEYTLENLLGVQVFLERDDGAGTDSDGSIPCLVYLAGPDGKPNFNKNFNKMIVQAGFAVIKKRAGSQFDPDKW
ncbi:Uncharacterised protein [uncultured archaeon]|nr:Uncharacterised protein [uncultured archaeon]